MSFMDLIYGAVMHPRKLFRTLAEQPEPGKAFLAVAIATLLTSISYVYVVFPGQITELQGMQGLAAIQEFLRLPTIQIIMLLASALFSLLWLIMQTGYYQVLADMLGAIPRSSLSLFSALAAAYSLQVLQIPVQALTALGVSQVLTALATMAIGIYVGIVLPILAVKEVTGLGTGRTLLVVSSPLIIVVMFLVLFLFGVGVAMEQFGDLFSTL